MKAILVPTDFSSGSQKALEIAARLAMQAGAELILLHVSEVESYVSPTHGFSAFGQQGTSDSKVQVQENITELKSELERQPTFAGLSIRTVQQRGSLVPVVENYAETHNIDLIVMGTRGTGGLEELLIGSNTEKVIRRSCCPVLAVPQEARGGEIKTVVFPTTLKDDQKVVFRRLAAMQKTLGNDIQFHLLHINDPMGLGSEEAIVNRYQELIRDSLLQNSTFYIRGALDLDEGVEILQFAKEQGADIISMGTHQRKGLSHLLLGSMTEDTVNHSDIPVLTIPIRL